MVQKLSTSEVTLK